MTQSEFDVVVIGAGPAGESVAARLSRHGGKRVAVVERELVGGECSFYACMPSKALLRPGELRRELPRVPGTVDGVGGLDVRAVLARRDEVIHNLDDAGAAEWLSDQGVALFRGRARIEGERRVRVGERLLAARDAVVLAVGSAALFPPIPGLAEAGAWSNRELTTSREVPPRLIVVGGGVVGVEMAQAWATLGSRVTLIEAAQGLLPGEEPFAGEQVRAALEQLGVVVHVGAEVEEVSREGALVTASLVNGEPIMAERMLVAAGRRPLTDDLGLETVGLPGGDFVEVDRHLRAIGADGLYAIGDVNGRSLLTHAAKYQARIAADHILGRPAAAIWDGPRVPRVVFTDPQVAAVGLTLAAATEAGIEAEPFDLETSASAGASFYGHDTPGTTRFVVDVDRRVLVGVTFVGFEVLEFLHAASIAVTSEIPLAHLAEAMPPFPTRSEVWLKFIDAFERGHGASLYS